VSKDEIPSILNGIGVAILTTSKGVMSDREARKKRIGGEVIGYVY
ncbi:MAG: 30S ribosomal protein S8, partial [candidate division WOR-3 bacterium]